MGKPMGKPAAVNSTVDKNEKAALNAFITLQEQYETLNTIQEMTKKELDEAKEELRNLDAELFLVKANLAQTTKDFEDSNQMVNHYEKSWHEAMAKQLESQKCLAMMIKYLKQGKKRKAVLTLDKLVVSLG